MVTSSVVRTSPDSYAITCTCGQSTALWSAQMQVAQHTTLHVPCGCGRTLQVIGERRRYTRKPVQLPGALLHAVTLAPLAPLTVIDISLGGLGLLTEWPDMHVGETFTVMFRLDDASQAVIQEAIVVQSVNAEQMVGAAFRDHENYNFDLDFYLSPFTVIL